MRICVRSQNAIVTSQQRMGWMGFNVSVHIVELQQWNNTLCNPLVVYDTTQSKSQKNLIAWTAFRVKKGESMQWNNDNSICI